MACNPVEVPDRLGEVYALSLELGGFLETDSLVRDAKGAMDDPLDPDIHRLLRNLVQIAASWLRGFPTVVGWDDAAGKALVQAALFQPARDFTRIARAQQAISERDAGEMELLGDAASADGYQGRKAGIRAVSSAKNLLLEMAAIFAASQAGVFTSEFARRAQLIQRAMVTLAKAGPEVGAFAATWPDDLGQALRALVTEGQRLAGSAPAMIPHASEPPTPNDVEEQAMAVIPERGKDAVEQANLTPEPPKYDVPPFRINFTFSERLAKFPEIMREFYANNGRWPHKWELPPMGD
jgi:hypothetical protein